MISHIHSSVSKTKPTKERTDFYAMFGDLLMLFLHLHKTANTEFKIPKKLAASYI